MIDIVVEWIAALPLMVLLLNFGFSLILRLTVRSTFLKKDYALRPRVSVLLPCFNEGEHVFRTIESILASDYPMDKVEVIAVDDGSADDTFAWIERASRQWPNVHSFRNPANAGKHQSLANALSHANGEFLICIDSDCLFDRRAIAEMMACFVDETIGAVGGRVGISNPNQNVLTQCQTVVYYYSFQIVKMLQNWARNVTCVSGCLFAVRRTHFEAIETQVKDRNWFGIGVRDGEDRYMTHLLLLKGLKTYIDIEAQCWTTAPHTIGQLFMQQLRWRRSGLRDLFWTMRDFRRNLDVMHPLTILNQLLPGTLQVLWPFMCVYGIASGWLVEHLLPDLQLHFWLWIIIGLLFNVYVNKHNPEQKINPFKLGALCIWFMVDKVLITIVAMCTFDVGDWGTRGIAAQEIAVSTELEPTKSELPMSARVEELEPAVA